VEIAHERRVAAEVGRSALAEPGLELVEGWRIGDGVDVLVELLLASAHLHRQGFRVEALGLPRCACGA